MEMPNVPAQWEASLSRTDEIQVAKWLGVWFRTVDRGRAKLWQTSPIAKEMRKSLKEWGHWKKLKNGTGAKHGWVAMKKKLTSRAI